MLDCRQTAYDVLAYFSKFCNKTCWTHRCFKHSSSNCTLAGTRYILNNITGPFIANYAPPTNGRGIADFTVTEATRPSADVSGNALQEDPALSTTRPLVLRAAALYGNDANIIQMASSVLDLVRPVRGLTEGSKVK